MISSKQQELYIKRFKKVINRIGEDVLGGNVGLDAVIAHCPDPVLFAKRLDIGEYKAVCEGDVWGRQWESAWFCLKGTVPTEWKGSKVIAELDFNS